MAALGALGIGLSIVFGGFVLVLLAELYYVFVWKRHNILSKRICRIGTECNGERGNFAHEAALVGSFGGYSSSSVDAEFVAKLFPMGPEAIGSDNMFMHGVFGDPRLLFTIKEETKEDMEFEEPVKQHKESATAAASFIPVQAMQSSSPKPPSASPSPKQLQQQQLRRQFSYSIGVIQQPQILRSVSTKSISWNPTPMQQQQQQQQKNVLQEPSDSSSHSSCSIPSSPAHRSSSTSPSRATSSSLSPILTSPKYQTFCSSGSSSPELFCMSKPIYDFSEENENEDENVAPSNIQSSGCPSPHDTETPFDTPMSSPSLLTPCGTPPMTPPLTPIKASKDPHGIPIGMASHSFGTSHSSSVDTNHSFSSSSENCKKLPIFHHPKRPSRPSPMVLPYYANTSTEKKHTLMERRAFTSLFNESPLQSLPRESARLNGLPPIPRVCRGTKPSSSSSSTVCSPSTPFSTAPSTPYLTPPIPNQYPITDPQAKDTAHSTQSSCSQT